MPILDTFRRLKRIPAGFILGRLNGAKGQTGDAELIPIDTFLETIGATLSAANVTYDNTTSGLTADDVQEAIDELAASIGSGAASDITFTPYDHVTSPNVQDAIEEVIDEFVSKVRTGTETMVASLTLDPGTGVACLLSLFGDGVNPVFFAQSYFENVNPPALIFRKGRGSEAAPAVLVQNDRVFSFAGQARSNISTNINAFAMVGRVIAATPSSTDMQSQFLMDVVPAGSATLSTIFSGDHTNGLCYGGLTNTFLDPDRVFRLRGFATGSLPANVEGKLTYDSTLDRPVWNDGTAWRKVPRLFTDLGDVPTTYSGQALEIVRVNAGETALEFTPLSADLVSFDDSGTSITADDVQEAIEELDAISGGGGVRVAGAYFNGATGDLGSGSSSAFATKGIIFTPDVDMHVDAIVAFIDGAGAGENHHGQIASLSGNTVAATVVASLGTTATVATATTNMRAYRFIFAAPVALVGGTSYLIAVVNASNIGTTALRVATVTEAAATGWWLNAPGDTVYAVMAYNTIDVTASQAASASATDSHACVHIEGTTD